VCRMADTDLDDQVSSVPMARHLVAELLHRWELPDLRDPATLLTSELVTNALVHAGSGLHLVVAVSDGVLELAVSDHDHLSAAAVRPRSENVGEEEPQVIAEGGRGLLLIDSLADEWGVAQQGQEKQVWCQLNTDEWAFGSDCGCRSQHDDRVRLASGRYALAMPGPWDT
jgi:phosphoserine phosphatase RsbU/P